MTNYSLNDLTLLRERIKRRKDSRYDNQFIELLDILIHHHGASVKTLETPPANEKSMGYKNTNQPPAPPQPSEIPDALRRNVAKAIDATVTYYKAEVGDRLANVYDVTDAVLREMRPYLATREPVSLARCADAITEAGNACVGLQGEERTLAKAVLDAAQVKYHED